MSRRILCLKPSKESYMNYSAKLPVKTTETGVPASAQRRRPFEALRQEFDRLFDEFDGGAWSSPFRRNLFAFEPAWHLPRLETPSPAVDIVEKDNAFEIIAELPGLDEKDVDVHLANGGLTISGGTEEETKEDKKDYYLHERRYGAFERTFRIPEGVDRSKIEAVFKKGVLTVTLPKTPDSKQAEKKIVVKAA